MLLLFFYERLQEVIEVMNIRKFSKKKAIKTIDYKYIVILSVCVNKWVAVSSTGLLSKQT